MLFSTFYPAARISGFCLALVMFAAACPAQTQDTVRTHPHLPLQAERDLQVLCSDSLAGRGYQFQGHTKAADYIAQRFRELGLKPLPAAQEARPDKPYQQRFSFPLHSIRYAACTLGQRELVIGHDFLPQHNCPQVKQSWPLADAGYGLPQDWEREDFAGKAVVLRKGLPIGMEVENDSMLRAYNRIENKLLAASKAGVGAVVLLEEKPTYALAPQAGPLPVIQLVDSLLGEQLPDSLHLEVRAKKSQIRSQNVLGYLPSERVPDTAVIVCGHYDHLGAIASTADTGYFYGANDNASGITFLLNLADSLRKLPRDLPYSVVFIAFGGEEAGLYGSRHYALDAPLWPLSRTRFVLNFDLMGNGQDGMMAVGAKDFPNLFELVETQHLADTACLGRMDQRPNAPNSDHFFFTYQGTPGLFFYSQGGSRYYHDVFDRPGEIELPVFNCFTRQVVQVMQKADSYASDADELEDRTKRRGGRKK